MNKIDWTTVSIAIAPTVLFYLVIGIIINKAL